MMTKKDYIVIAEAIRQEREGKNQRQFPYVMADLLAQDNARFDRAKFLEACGVITEAVQDDKVIACTECNGKKFIVKSEEFFEAEIVDSDGTLYVRSSSPAKGHEETSGYIEAQCQTCGNVMSVDEFDNIENS